MLEFSISFFNYLNSNRIRYCHWKSNCRLTKSLNGETDLDILVDENDKLIFELALKKFDFKKVLSAPARHIPEVEEYLGLDQTSGRLIHLHVHYRLVLGQRYIKNHHLPIEVLIFDNLIQKNHVNIPCPEIELILLIIRANMKLGADSIIKHALKNLVGKSYTPYPSNIEKEIEELISECDIEKLKRLVNESKLPLSEDIFAWFIDGFSRKKLRLYDIVKWRWQILHRLKGYRRDTDVSVTIRYYILFVQNMPFIKKFFKSKKKTLVDRGRIISIVGADGSGKSTIVKDISHWLSWKLDVKKVYFGIPKTYLVKYWDMAIRGFNKLRLHYVANLLNVFLCIYIARLRYGIFNRSQADVAKGRIVVTDRFPLKEFHNMEEPMDGPRLSSLRMTIFQRFANLEESFYSRILLPDRVFVLQVNVDELRRRKADIAFEKHLLKAEAVNAINESPLITVIDASHSCPEVLLEVKRKIWDII